jgi:predicted phosphate transport protein (TIGR00153 family)
MRPNWRDSSPIKREGSVNGGGLRASETVRSEAMGRDTPVLSAHDRAYFDLFDEAGQNMLSAATLLYELLIDYPDNAELAKRILDLEHEGDRITHDIIDRLNHTSETPIERVDILSLASALDDVVDFVEEVADYLGLYKIEAPMEQSIALARVLRDATAQLSLALGRLRDFEDISSCTVEVNRLENEGDRITREGVASLFDGGIDPMVVIRWKDLFERLEAGVDATERAANIIEGIFIKNS